MKKALFIDRDGTIIAEPADEQIDSLEKLAFVPGAISALKALTGLGFDLVLATNQDGLGTPSFPEDTFWPAHNKMLATLGGEGVAFDDQLIDRTFEADAAPTRKPRTGMFGRYTGGEYDLAASYVIGDRATDILLARNLGARGILLAPPAEGLRTLEESGAADACALVTDSWSEIAEFIRRGERRLQLPDGHTMLFPYDRLTVVGTDEEFRIFHRVLDEQRSERKRRREEKTATALRIGSYTLPARSALDGTTLGEAEVRRHASALVLGIERPEGPVTNPSAGERLHAGDVVWAVGDPQRMKPFFEAVRQE